MREMQDDTPNISSAKGQPRCQCIAMIQEAAEMTLKYVALSDKCFEPKELLLTP